MADLHPLIGTNDHRQQQQPPSSSHSGSEHLAEECLSEMVVDFLEDYDGYRSSWAEDDLTDGEAMDVMAAGEGDCREAVGEIRRMVSVKGGNNVEGYREVLVDNVRAAASSLEGVVSRRRLVLILRELHYNAAICKTKWGSSRGVAAGDYEFVDVVNGNIRYLIDTNFRAQFEIARATVQYKELLKSLPLIFIGTVEELKKMVRIMCDAAKVSLNHRNLSVPPWRKGIYMKNKWLGPYRRTINPIQEEKSPTTTLDNSTSWAVKCRWIGFDTTNVETNINVSSVCVRSIKAG
ncbi:uncharacterized protein E6C27_scaffold238G00420 [Cucumis melo var. makuwa]|uniref:Uncharacterized protein n=1 Tax=Cucumis melo var. makuwa TaxID=1194695 RepID=A0A5A7VSJ2_CUCMM|nr:uncharacterized protein E6C27_scaffold238G00420 [Cucumis melo var. makuwa]